MSAKGLISLEDVYYVGANGKVEYGHGYREKLPTNDHEAEKPEKRKKVVAEIDKKLLAVFTRGNKKFYFQMGCSDDTPRLHLVRVHFMEMKIGYENEPHFLEHIAPVTGFAEPNRPIYDPNVEGFIGCTGYDGDVTLFGSPITVENLSTYKNVDPQD